MKICSNSAKPKTIYKTLKPQQKCGFNANNPYWGFLCFYGSPQYVGVVFSKQADAFASRRGGVRFRLAATYFEKAKHPTRKASGGQSLLEHNAPRLSGGAPKPQWRKERKICSA